MIKIRVFEEQIRRLVDSNPSAQPVRFREGAEAVVAAVCSSLHPQDRVFATADPHRHLIAKGLSLSGLLEEILGTQDSRTLGKGGWADVADEPRGVFPGSGSPMSLAVGAGVALSDSHLHRGHVTAVIVNSPVPSDLFRESVEVSRSWSLPVLYVVDASRCADHAMRPLAYLGLDKRVPRYAVDGNDVVAVAEAVSRAARHIRVGYGPSVVDATASGPCGAPSAPHGLLCSAHDPIAAYRTQFGRAGLRGSQALAVIEAEERVRVEEAVASLGGSAFPDPEEAVTGLYAGAPDGETS